MGGDKQGSRESSACAVGHRWEIRCTTSALKLYISVKERQRVAKCQNHDIAFQQRTATTELTFNARGSTLIGLTCIQRHTGLRDEEKPTGHSTRRKRFA